MFIIDKFDFTETVRTCGAYRQIYLRQEGKTQSPPIIQETRNGFLSLRRLSCILACSVFARRRSLEQSISASSITDTPRTPSLW